MSLIIFDWDDTLYPTTWLLSNGINMSDKYYFEELDNTLYKLLNKCLKIAKVIIITNAEKTWIYNKSETLPKTFRLLKKIPVVSARKYNSFIPTESELYQWKKDTFMRVVSNENFYNIISIGDSFYEYNALVSLHYHFGERMFLKPILTLKNLSYDKLIEELIIIDTNIIKIVQEKKNLDKIISM
jgi:hypothetical protein